jgi:hypothetical protein
MPVLGSDVRGSALRQPPVAIEPETGAVVSMVWGRFRVRPMPRTPRLKQAGHPVKLTHAQVPNHELTLAGFGYPELCWAANMQVRAH